MTDTTIATRTNLLEQTKAALAELLGRPEGEESGYQAVLRWRGPKGVVVNLFTGAKEEPLVWVHANGQAKGELDLDTFDLKSARTPLHDDCSDEIAGDHAQHMRVRSEAGLLGLLDHLRDLSGASDSEGDVRRKLEAIVERHDADDELEEDEGDTSFAQFRQRKVLTQPSDEGIAQLVHKMSRGRIIVQPEFQREYVWKKSKATALIESVLMNIPLPVVYLAEREDNRLEVVDGQQRLTTLRAFFEGRFPSGEAFRLGKMRVMPELRGKSFKELPEDLQQAFEDYNLRIITIQKEADPELKFDVFERLNSGAERLNEMELRNCIYRGPYNDLLGELVNNKDFLAIRGDERPDPRMRDRQLILRFLAFCRNTHLKYTGNMKGFLNREMEEHRDAPPAELEKMRFAFENAISMARTVFGERAFRRYSPGDEKRPGGRWEGTAKINVALWDTILYTFSQYEKRQVIPAADAIREEFLDLMTYDLTFVDHIGRFTDSPAKVKYRADEWRRRMESVIRIPEGEVRRYSEGQKRALFEQDQTCAICTQRILFLEDAEVDHIQHYWRGGRTLPENARLTHRYCNRARGGRH